MTDASLTRGRPSTVSAFSATCLYALAFAGCAFATYVAHDWVRSYPSLPRFETMPDPVEFFWRPRTAVFGALCFYYPLRMWLRREETDLGFLVTFPYMLSYVLPRTVGVWFAGYIFFALATEETKSPEGAPVILVVIALIALSVLEMLGKGFRHVVESGVNAWERNYR